MGYNAVDLAEEDEAEYEKALLLNRDLPKFLAQESVKQGFLLVHYSSDYVFDGTLEPPAERQGCAGGCCGGNCHGSKEGYNEDALPNPISRYGETKYAGEEEVENACQRILSDPPLAALRPPSKVSSGQAQLF